MNGNSIAVELDASTGELLEHLARMWGVSREEAVRRAVAQAEASGERTLATGRLEAFQELQRRLHLTSEKADAWQAAVREGRR